MNLEEKLNAIELDTMNELMDLREKLVNNEESKLKVDDEVNTAKENADGLAYSKGLNEQRAYDEIIRMLINKIEKIENTPLLTKPEYLDLKNEIIKTLDDSNAKAKSDLMPLMEKVEVLKDNLQNDINKGNELLERLHRQIYKEPMIVNGLENGRAVTKATTTDEYKNRETIYEMSNALEKSGYNNFKKEGR